MSVTSERIKLSRQQKKLTQSGLAELINSSRGSVAKIETDVFTPSYAMLSLIADALDTTVDYLQGNTDIPTKTIDSNVNTGDENKKRVDLSDDELIMSFEGKELSEDYKQAILAMLKTLREDKK
ncbi:helix-turn-helix transcriptional regulator [Leuconostoc suionicum]|jgi:transcriptional regulator with XRE-family HTH domain|uniref:helix-turn-helix domain-containing protein n=1 Tax=Leuconostoc suionicum TaxID=1511761 RepID=UPI0019CC89DD|nr:helix-turn-helix transcriptional regulator [Leuconostoc suionicum]MBC9702883.1 helix-turn-helix transcriptional regulator [Leuconostoc sp.]MDI6497763.1 helix-turn-helix transcriptional regulator [Leuconostoc suionicum]MDI6499835.1 helix-turn-helix transcriptional regulator [Leuconostoc suionicum]MDI6502016.1 helix-turn-helix transcriptional regulator [Leuconostoc suionicum]MDI6613902.1 helix-turn-helix transcriptional regulator [Leuconostoc suionicum]